MLELGGDYYIPRPEGMREKNQLPNLKGQRPSVKGHRQPKTIFQWREPNSYIHNPPTSPSSGLLLVLPLGLLQ